MRFNNFTVIPRPESAPRRIRFGIRPLRERIGTFFIRIGERIGGRNARAEGYRDIAHLAMLDNEMTRHGGSDYRGPWC